MSLNVSLCLSVYRRLALQKEKRTITGSKIPCCSRLKYYIIIVSHSRNRKHLSVFYFLSFFSILHQHLFRNQWDTLQLQIKRPFLALLQVPKHSHHMVHLVSVSFWLIFISRQSLPSFHSIFWALLVHVGLKVETEWFTTKKKENYNNYLYLGHPHQCHWGCDIMENTINH